MIKFSRRIKQEQKMPQNLYNDRQEVTEEEKEEKEKDKKESDDLDRQQQNMKTDSVSVAGWEELQTKSE